MKKTNKIISYVMGVFAALVFTTAAFLSTGFEALAENTELVPTQNYEGRLMSLTDNVNAYDSKSTSGNVVKEYYSGDMVFMVDEDDEWYTILFDDQLLYIAKSANPDAAILLASDTEALDAELARKAKNDEAWIASFNSQLRAMRNARIWRVSIIIVIIALVAFIVYKGVKENGGKDNKDKK